MRISKADRIARDLELLAALGRTQTWEFAEHMGCSEQTAKNRLRRLYEAGLADRHKERGRNRLGTMGWTYRAKP